MERIKVIKGEDFMGKAIVRGSNAGLPVKPEELQRYTLFTTGKLNAQKALLNTIKKVGVGKAVYDQKLKEGQDMAGIVLIAEARLGELLSMIPRKVITKKHSSTSGTMLFPSGTEKSLPNDVNKKQSHEAQKLARNKDVINEIIDAAIKTHDIPTRSKVLRKIDSKNKEKAEAKKVKRLYGVV